MAAVPSAAGATPRNGLSPAPLPAGRRGSELAMLCFALAIVALAFASVGFGLNGHLPAGLVLYVGGFAALMIGAHLTVRWLAPWADPLLVPLAAVLNGLGIVMIYRLQEAGRHGNAGAFGLPVSTLTAHSAVYQLVWTAVGIAAFIAVLVVFREPRILQRYTYTIGLVGLLLLAFPIVLPASHSEVNGAKEWIIFGGFSIQPGEFAKIALAVFFAGYLVAKRDVLSLAGRRFLGIDLPRARDLGPILVVWGLNLLILIAEQDIGASGLFFGLFVVMLYIATQRKSWLLIGVGLFAAAALIAWVAISHVAERFTIWLDPFNPATIHGISEQLAYGLEGMAFGGLFGTGLGQGQPYWTPLVQSDFIFTGFGEELGLVGVMALLLIFGLLVQRGLRTAIAIKDPFSKLLAGGLAFSIALQLFIIVGGVTQLIPLTGVTTPFLSQGGSSLVASWMIIAILIRISDTARRPAPQSIQDEGLTQVVRAL